jgi:hypothetical protein
MHQILIKWSLGCGGGIKETGQTKQNEVSIYPGIYPKDQNKRRLEKHRSPINAVDTDSLSPIKYKQSKQETSMVSLVQCAGYIRLKTDLR